MSVSYEFENALNAIKDKIVPYIGKDNEKDNIQYYLETLMVSFNKCQEYFHGVNNGVIYNTYAKIKVALNGENNNGGLYNNTLTLIDLTNTLYSGILSQAKNQGGESEYDSYPNEIVGKLSNLDSVAATYCELQSFTDFTLNAEELGASEYGDFDINFTGISEYAGKSCVGAFFEQLAINLKDYGDCLNTITTNYPNDVYQYAQNQEIIDSLNQCLANLKSCYEEYYKDAQDLLYVLNDIVNEIIAKDARFKNVLEEINNNITTKIDIPEQASFIQASQGGSAQSTQGSTSQSAVLSTPILTTPVVTPTPVVAENVVPTATETTPVAESTTPLVPAENDAYASESGNLTTLDTTPIANQPATTGDINRTVIPNPYANGQTTTLYQNTNGIYYDLRIPANIEEDAPLIVYLPGIGGWGTEAKLQGDGGGSFTNGVNAVNPNAYVLQIQYPDGTDGLSDANVNNILNTIYSTIDAYGIDRRRVSICGYSKGSYIMPRVINKDPSLFSKAAFIASNAGNTENLTNLLNMPIKGYYGTKDGWSYPTANLVTRINNAGGTADLTVFPGVDHAGMPGYAIADGMIDFLLS